MNVAFDLRSLAGLGGRGAELEPVEDRGVVGLARFGLDAGPSGFGAVEGDAVAGAATGAVDA